MESARSVIKRSYKVPGKQVSLSSAGMISSFCFVTSRRSIHELRETSARLPFSTYPVFDPTLTLIHHLTSRIKFQDPHGRAMAMKTCEESGNIQYCTLIEHRLKACQSGAPIQKSDCCTHVFFTPFQGQSLKGGARDVCRKDKRDEVLNKGPSSKS